jgi:acyl-CoA thioester hydrolase
MTSIEAFRTTHAVIIERPVNWGDMDAFQHLNNTVYFRYFESARIAHFDQLGIMTWMEDHQQGPILAHTEARFRAPVHYPDTVLIGSNIVDLGEDRFTMNHGVWSTQLSCRSEFNSRLSLAGDDSRIEFAPTEL